MEIFKTKSNLQKYLSNLKQNNLKIGFVPTMGALHSGHLSLIKNSITDNDITVASIFVNPTQFNDSNDLRNYPRDEETDCALLEKAGCNIVFIPTIEEMYPKSDTFFPIELDGLDEVMEGKYRKGHFNGVVQIIGKLFDIVMPNRAYFGEKDYQQLAIIKLLVKKRNYPIEIIPCATIRENDGLAMSSRNQLLNTEQRTEAAQIPKILKSASEKVYNTSIIKIKEEVEKQINSNPQLKLEYFEIAKEDTLQTADTQSGTAKLRCFIAVNTGKIRLIDNMKS